MLNVSVWTGRLRSALRASGTARSSKVAAHIGAAAALTAVALLGAPPKQAAPQSAPPAQDSASARSKFKRIPYADSALSLNDQCPVRHGALNPNIAAVYVNGHPVGFCWHSCPKVFGEDPGPYLRALGISVPCPVDLRRPAILERRLRVDMNLDLYFFSSPRAMKRFLASPLRYCGGLTDPVTQMRFHPTERSPRLTHKGRVFYFESEETMREFQAAPDSLCVRREG